MCDWQSETFGETDFQNCRSKVHDKIAEILEEAKNIDSLESQITVSDELGSVARNYSKNMSSDDVNDVAKIVNFIIDFEDSDEGLDEKVKANIIQTFDSVQKSVSSQEMTNKNAAASIRKATVKFRNRLSADLNGGKIVYIKEQTLSVIVAPYKTGSTSFVVSGDSTNLTNSRIDLNFHSSKELFSMDVPDYKNASLTAVLYNGNNFYPENETVTDVTEAVTHQFQAQGRLQKTVSKVVSLIADIEYANFEEKINFENGRVIEMNFTVEHVKQPLMPNKLALQSKYECAFYNIGSKLWVTGKEFGCNTSITVLDGTKKKRVNCKCSHMTSFAVLMSFDSDYNPLEGTVTSILLWTSLGCLILTIISYLPARDMLKTRPVRINLLLVTSLIFSILAFLSLEHLTDQSVGKMGDFSEGKLALLPCTIVAFLMNYFWLCQIAWMVCEAVVMYRAFISNVFNSHISNYMFKFNLACWGIPLIFPTIGIIWAGSKFANPSTCFLRMEYGLVTFYAPIILCTLFNTFIFIKLSWTVLWKNERESCGLSLGERQSRKKQMKFAVTVMTLLGITWILGFFLIVDGINTIWLRWLFIVFNSTQGIFIFYLYVLQNKDLLKVWKTLLCFRRRAVRISGLITMTEMETSRGRRDVRSMQVAPTVSTLTSQSCTHESSLTTTTRVVVSEYNKPRNVSTG